MAHLVQQRREQIGVGLRECWGSWTREAGEVDLKHARHRPREVPRIAHRGIAKERRGQLVLAVVRWRRIIIPRRVAADADDAGVYAPAGFRRLGEQPNDTGADPVVVADRQIKRVRIFDDALPVGRCRLRQCHQPAAVSITCRDAQRLPRGGIRQVDLESMDWLAAKRGEEECSDSG